MVEYHVLVHVTVNRIIIRKAIFDFQSIFGIFRLQVSNQMPVKSNLLSMCAGE